MSDTRDRQVAGTRFAFKLEGIAHVLKDRHLAVPVYQRSFAWTADEIDEFWTDISTAFQTGRAEYFLGTLVLSAAERDGFMIIDGQQRLATAAILLSAIRDAYTDLGDSEGADSVQNEYLASWDRRERIAVPHLTLNHDDDEVFRRLVVDRNSASPIKPSHPSHELLIAARSRLASSLQETLERLPNGRGERLNDWLDYLENRVQAMAITVPDETDAYLIFETLNDRGAELKIADLLKNFLFGRAGKQLAAVRQGWTRALAMLDLSPEDVTFTTFLRHYWSSLYGFTRERDLYRQIKGRIGSERDAREFVEGLQKAARLYAALLNSGHEYWQALGARARENVETLLRLQLEQHRPLLLSAMLHLTDVETRKLLRAMVAWSVRGMVVGGIGKGRTEAAYSAAAVAIREKRITTKEGLYRQLLPIIPPDEEFLGSFALMQESRSKIARYYLLALERTHKGELEPELVPNANEEEVNLEHVLPSKPGRDWPSFTSEQQKLYLHRLGNMVLLGRKKNVRIGNKPYSVKRPILLASELELTAKAAQRETWTPAAIQERQMELAALAVRAWPHNP